MNSTLFKFLLTLMIAQQINTSEQNYLNYVKEKCFIKGEALSCIKYKALKIAKNTFFGDIYSNKTITANKLISFVPLDDETIKTVISNDEELLSIEPKGFSEWTELTNYIIKLLKDFFRLKGMRVILPDGARTVEEPYRNNERGRRKKLAVIIPLLTLLAAVKTKLLLIPILLGVLFIKKVLLAAALLLPSLLSTLKGCRHQFSPLAHYSYFGGSDSSDFSSDYGNSYGYSSSGAYGKDWAANRAYTLPKPRPTPSPMYVTAPGGAI